MYAFGADPAGPEGRRRSLAQDSLRINHKRRPSRNDSSDHELRKQWSKDDMYLPNNNQSNFVRGGKRRLTIGGDSSSSIGHAVGYKGSGYEGHFECSGHSDKPTLQQYHQRRLTVAYDNPCTPLRNREDLKSRQNSIVEYNQNEDNENSRNNKIPQSIVAHVEKRVESRNNKIPPSIVAHVEKRVESNRYEDAEHIEIDYKQRLSRPQPALKPVKQPPSKTDGKAAVVSKAFNRAMYRVPRKVLILDMYNKGENQLPEKDATCYVPSLKPNDSFPPTYLLQSCLLFLLFPFVGIFALARSRQTQRAINRLNSTRAKEMSRKTQRLFWLGMVYWSLIALVVGGIFIFSEQLRKHTMELMMTLFQ